MSDIPPYQIQGLLRDAPKINCAQALASDIYVGCETGDLLRYALLTNDPNEPAVYTLLSRQTVPMNKPIDEIVLLPSLSRALVLSDHQLFFYILPSLDPVPSNIIKPIRHVVALAVDNQHLLRPPPPPGTSPDTVNFCIVKKLGIALYTLKDRLIYQKEIPLPQSAFHARRTGNFLCLADGTNYNVVDLSRASLISILPLSQVPDAPPVRPSITVIGPNEFLILSFTGAGALGVFITGDGDPVRGTLEWPAYPEAVCLDYPYITTLLPNGTIEIHNVETQTLSQVLPASMAALSPPTSPPSSRSPPPGPRSPPQRAQPTSQQQEQRMHLASSHGGYLVPSSLRSERMQMVKVPLLRT